MPPQSEMLSIHDYHFETMSTTVFGQSPLRITKTHYITEEFVKGVMRLGLPHFQKLSYYGFYQFYY